jgi:drug/metabolite transporter (DMT)-like permease
MGILLGLASALSWGTADLLARFVTHKIGTFRTMLYMQLLGFALLSMVMHGLGGWGHLFDGSGPRPWIYGILAGLLNTFSTLALYRSFEIGKMSIVAPVSASYPVLTLLLSMMTGERLTVARLVGIACTVTGVILVARGETQPHEANPVDENRGLGKKNVGLEFALLSAVGFGVMFWLLGLRVVPLLGAAPSVWLIRLTSVVATAVAILAMRASMAPPRRGAGPLVLCVSIFDTSSYLMNNYGMRLEQTSVVSVLASLYGAVTVALAAIFLREPVSKLQWAGIVSIFVGIALISR